MCRMYRLPGAMARYKQGWAPMDPWDHTRVDTCKSVFNSLMRFFRPIESRTSYAIDFSLVPISPD